MQVKFTKKNVRQVKPYCQYGTKACEVAKRCATGTRMKKFNTRWMLRTMTYQPSQLRGKWFLHEDKRQVRHLVHQTQPRLNTIFFTQ